MENNKIDLSPVSADSEAIRLLAAELSEEMEVSRSYLAHAIYAIAEHQLMLLADA